MNPSTQTHCGIPGTQPVRMVAAPVASAATTTTSCSQYTQPTALPTLRPMALWAKALKAPDLGSAATISASIDITSITMTPEPRQEIRTAGPAMLIACLAPTNRPAPMALPSPIMEIWRRVSPRCSPVLDALVSTSVIGAGVPLRRRGPPEGSRALDCSCACDTPPEPPSSSLATSAPQLQVLLDQRARGGVLTSERFAVALHRRGDQIGSAPCR